MSEAARIFRLPEGRDAAPADSTEGRAEERVDSLTAITARLRDFRDRRDWQQFHTPRNLAVSISIESGELLEQFQWVDDEGLEAHVEQHRETIGEELADVVIYAIQLADVLELSLADVIDSKIDLNESRYPAAVARGSASKYTELRDVDSSVEHG